MSLLARYTAQATKMSDDALDNAVADIKACWNANAEWQEPSHPYGKKLWAEWDAYIVERQKRRKQKGG